MQKKFSLFSLRKRIIAIMLVIFILFCSLMVRLFIIQVIQGYGLQLRATDQWTRDLKLIAPRGKIYDRTGDTLAVSYTTYNIYVRAREVKNASETAFVLSKKLDIDYTSTYNKITNKKVSEVLIKMQVQPQIAEEIYNQKLSGVYLAESSDRYYTYGDLLTQILGFTSIDNVGQTGVEAYYDSYLKGVDGYSYVQSDLQGREIGGSLRYYYPSKEGNDLSLTIDSKIQIIVEQVLEQIMVEQKAKNVTGIVLDANTAQILALSTKPSFDLNDIPRDDLQALFEQSKVKAATDIYEPGSTFKILTVAAALEEGLTSLEDRFYCPGYRMVDGVRIKCWKTIGHGSQTLTEAFANSCNCCFMDLALRLGTEKFYSYMTKFGFGQKTGVDITGESKGMLMAKSLVKNVDLARMGFGHAIAVTPLQLLNAVSCVINGGDKCCPHILKNICDCDKNELKSENLTKKSDILSKNTSNLVNSLLEYAENKKGKYTFVEGYNVGGKTGTAQKYKESGGIDQGKYISSFIGTYPADNPRYIVYIMVDEPSNGAYYGSIVAAPYGKIIFSKMFGYLGEQKQDENARVEYVKMPNLIGKSIADAAVILSQFNLDFELDGEDGQYVLGQLPPEGTEIAKGTTIVLKV